MKKIAIMTAGGDCCGLNNVIYTIVKIASERNIEVLGIEDGYKGFVEGKYIKLDFKKVKDIYHIGGSILGSSNKECPFKYLVNKEKKEYKDMTKTAIDKLNDIDINDIIIVGGDGTLDSARDIYENGMNVIGIPKTIDNDMGASDITIGFETAVEANVEAMAKIKTTAASHRRCIVLETMGRTAGFLTLYTGVAGAADVILLPEIDFNLEKVCNIVKDKAKVGQRDILIVMSEAAKENGASISIGKIVEDSFEQVRYGGAADKLAKQIEKITNIETRAQVLGYIQRGGETCAMDRILATRLAAKAIDLLCEDKGGVIVGVKGSLVKTMQFPKDRIPRILNTETNDLVKAARNMGISFGD
ncbi:MAG: ATP-dependent 6-phosphofructokinase [Clostridia bacterium]